MDAEETGLAARAAQAGATGALYAPLLAPMVAPVAAPDGCFVLGRLAQSIDGRIATRNGASRWISGEADVRHTHRLRAIFDAVLVGAGTVAADDPQLTTRAVPGPSPVRVILDASRRLPEHHRVFRSEARTIVACAEDVADCPAGDAERLLVPRGADGLDLAALLAALAARGLRRVFVEGGGVTVSRFLAAGLLDRLHLTIAPLLLGSGIPAFVLPDAASPAEGLRVRWTTHRLGDDILLDIPLDRARPGCCL
jgi:diaminohydroxyphosphoribosylaminopyrimidine deaminase / 5-amino-6-(5-phosphoribosylamino)uracil reductase